jgi:hypothetical protein
MTKTKDYDLWRCFNSILKGQYTQDRVKCKFCTWEGIAIATRMRKHRDGCEGYEKHIMGQNKQQRSDIKPYVVALTPEQKVRIDLLAVKALITGGRPLSLFDSQEMQEFITVLNPGYTAPSRK